MTRHALNRALCFRRDAGRFTSLADFYRAFAMAFLRGCYHQILGPRRDLPKFAAVSRSLPHAIFVARGLRQPSSKARHFTLFGVYFWSVIQDRCDRRVRTVGILDRQAARRRAKAITKHLAAIAETSAELLRLFDNWLAPSVGLRQYLWADRRESIETARKLIELISPVVLKTVLGYLVLNYWGHRSGWAWLIVCHADQVDLD